MTFSTPVAMNESIVLVYFLVPLSDLRGDIREAGDNCFAITFKDGSDFRK